MPTPTAFVHLPTKAHYRREAFINGFARLGYIVQPGQPTLAMQPHDVAVVWNRTARSQKSVDYAKKGGAALIVVENGYYGKDANGLQPYAMALDGHNGSGRWYAPDATRLERLEIDFKPFRPQEGRKVVIAAQRGIGSRLMASPRGFAEDAADRLRQCDFHPHIRPHPGAEPPATRLLDDLEDARCLVVWSSNCATEALINGIPTYYDAPTIVTAGGARKFAHALDAGFYEARRQDAFARMAWAQWFLSEITSGQALQTLIDVHQGRLPSCKAGYGL